MKTNNNKKGKMRKELEKKIEQSIKLLRSIPTDKGR